MKWTHLISAAVLSAGVLVAALPAQAQSTRSRLQNQERRIRQGVRQGDLSHSEARKLQRKHHRLVRRYRSGSISRHQLNKKLNNQGKAIKHQRSDDEHR